MKRLVSLVVFLVLFGWSANAQTVYSWTPGVDPGWTSSDGVLSWSPGCAAVTTNCGGNYANNLFTYYFSGPINTTCTMASTVIPSFDITGNAESGYDLIYFYYSYDGFTWINFYGAGVGFSGNTFGLINQALPAIATSPTTYFLILFESDWIFTYSGYRISNWSVDCNVVLPVELTDFKGTNEEGKNVLEWTTSSEINNSHFELHRSTDGQQFDLVTIVDGVGNSSEENSYKVEDDKFEEGKINYYRLKQVDFDGKEEVFDIISIDNRKVEAKVLKTLNMMGQVVDENYSGIVIDYYSDGSIVKRYQL